MKKITTLASLCLFCFQINCFAQKVIEGYWGKAYLNTAYAVAATTDGGYIMTGLTKNGRADDYGDIVVIKNDAMGDTQWTMVYGGLLLEGGNAVMQTSDGGYLVSGHTQDFGARDCDAYMMKLDKDGNHQWFKIFGGDSDDVAEQTIQLSDGGYIFAGLTASYGNPPNGPGISRHIYFVRTDANGDSLWTKYYAGKGTEYCYSIATVASGGFISCGFSNSFGAGELEGWLLRLKDNGDTLWTRLYTYGGDTKLMRIMPTADNGYIIAGYNSLVSGSIKSGLIIKLDAEGNELWEKAISDSRGDIVFNGVTQLPDGNFIFAGQSKAEDPAGNVYMLTTDANGNKISDQLAGGTNSLANGIANQGNNSHLIAGTTSKYGDSYGNLYWWEMNNTIAQVPTIKTGWPRLFPNPVSNQPAILVLSGAEANETVTIDITTITGKLISRQENILAKDIVFSRNLLPAGQYQYKVTCLDGVVYKGQFVIE